MLRMAICDDMAVFAERIAGIIETWTAKRYVNAQLTKFFSGEELLADIEETGYYDIIFMDIELPGGMNGITAAAKIKKIYSYSCIIFISQYDYYKEVYQVRPFHYLEKTTPKSKIIEVLDQAVHEYRYLHEIYTFRFRGKTYNIILREVLYFLSDKRTVKVMMENGEEFIFYYKLDDLEQELRQFKSLFLRIHKSYLINGTQVEQYCAREVLMRNKSILPISVDKREYVGRFHMALLEKNY